MVYAGYLIGRWKRVVAFFGVLSLAFPLAFRPLFGSGHEPGSAPSIGGGKSQPDQLAGYSRDLNWTLHFGTQQSMSLPAGLIQ
jgi:hypothetical protein